MKNTMRKVGGTVAMFALALSATGALAHGSDVKSHDPRQAVAMEEVVLVSKDGVLAGETTGQGGGGGVVGCGFVARAKAAGLDVIMNACPAQDARRFGL